VDGPKLPSAMLREAMRSPTQLKVSSEMLNLSYQALGFTDLPDTSYESISAAPGILRPTLAGRNRA
jgi:hypothetical protein